MLSTCPLITEQYQASRNKVEICLHVTDDGLVLWSVFGCVLRERMVLSLSIGLGITSNLLIALPHTFFVTLDLFYR